LALTAVVSNAALLLYRPTLYIAQRSFLKLLYVLVKTILWIDICGFSWYFQNNALLCPYNCAAKDIMIQLIIDGCGDRKGTMAI